MVTQVFYTGMPGPLEREKLNDLWNRQSGEFTSTSVSSVLMGTGAKSFQVQAGKAYVVGQRIGMLALSAPANYMLGTVSSYAGTTLGVTVDEVSGAGTHATWLICTSTEFPAASAAVMAEFGKRALGAHQFLSYNRGSVICHVGDSNTVARPAYRSAYEPGWFGVGGVFEGWTSYNLGSNGETATSYAGQIITGNQNEAPADYVAGGPRGGQPWQVINAKPDVIVLSFGTNDFRTGAGPATLAAVTTQFRNSMATLINFFLVRTNASIVLRLPQPLVFANPDPDGYTDCINADDAAARSAAMRTVYLEWMNQSDRVKVVDTHKHLFGYRIDSLAASVDPETGGALMSDTLHPIDLGYARIVQIIAKTLNPNLPYTTKANLVSDTIYKNAFWAKTVVLEGSGTNYFQVASNPQAKKGRVTRADGVRTPLNNIPFIDDAGFFGALSDLQELSNIGECYIYFHDNGATFGPLRFNFTADFPLNGYTQFNTTTTQVFGSHTGPATFYTLTPQNNPHFQDKIQPIEIVLNGPNPLTVGASGGVMVKFANNRSVSIGTVRGTRADGGGAATIDVYKGNTVTGAFNATPYPGLRLGTLSFANGFKFGPTWAVDTANFPTGPAIFEGTNQLVAVGITGNLGQYCAITIDPL